MSTEVIEGKEELEQELARLRSELRLREAEITHLNYRMKNKSKSMRRFGRSESMDHRMHALDLSGGLMTPTSGLGSDDSGEIHAVSSRPAGLKRDKKQDLRKKSSSRGNVLVHKALRKSVSIIDTVAKGAVKTGKGIGSLFRFKSERQKRLSTTRLDDKTKTRWDNAVDLIDDLVYDDSNKLSAEEKAGLKEVQELLLGGGVKENDYEKAYHIPLNLLESTERSSKRVSLASKSYVLKEYGGLSNFSRRPKLERQLGVRAEKSMLSLEEWDDSIPAEFQSLSKEDKCRVTAMLTWEKLKVWDFDVFELDEISKGHPLVLMGWAILGAPHAQHAMAACCNTLNNCSERDFKYGYNFVESSLQVPLEQLCLYLRLVEDNYRKGNPYHNAIHAADVVQTLHSLIQMAGDELKTTDDETFSALLAAVVHDVDHPGLNNSYQVNARTNLSLEYNDISVLENHHASKAFTMMIKSSPFGEIRPATLLRAESANLDKECDFNILRNLDKQHFADVKSKTIEAILHTDMKLHFKTVSKIKGLIMSEETKDEANTAWQILIFMLHIADISNAAKSGLVSRKWTDRCLEEFFHQGDQEKLLGIEPSPQCDREKTSKPDSQIGFISFVVQPAFEVLACIIPEIRDVVIPHLEHNRQFWEVENRRTEEDTDENIESGHDETEETDLSEPS